MHSYIIVEAMFNCCHSDGETTKKTTKKNKVFFYFFLNFFFYVYKCCFEMIKGWKKRRGKEVNKATM